MIIVSHSVFKFIQPWQKKKWWWLVITYFKQPDNMKSDLKFLLHRNVNFTYILFTRSYLPFTDMFKKIKDLNIAFSNDRLCIQLLGIIAEKKSTWLPDLWDLGLCCPPGSRIPGHTARGVGQSLTAAEVALAAVYAVWRLLRAWNKCFFYQACRIFLWIFDPCELWNKIR